MPPAVPLPGVTVSISGDRGSKAEITDSAGSYRFNLLVPGAYTVSATLEGFQEADAAITVTAGKKSQIDLKMRLGTSEEITVTSEAPMVDKFNVTAGSSITAEVGEQTAGSTRTYYGVINALPGVTSDAQNDDIQQTRPSVNGTHFADNAVYIDGVDTTFAKFGGSRVFLPTTAVTEVSMEAGGSSAEYGRVIGSSTNVIVKSGTNKWKADALIQRQELDWGSDYKEQPSLANREINPFPVNWFDRTPAEEEGGSDGYELSFGGPLARDKAWFFLGWSKFDDAFQERLLGKFDTDGNIIDGGDPYDASLQNEALIAKFNLQPSAAHSISASWIDTPGFRNYFNQESYDYWTPTPHDIDGDLGTINWNWSISSNFFLETKIAQQTSTENKLLACNSINVEECLALKQQDRGPAAGHSSTNTSAPSDLPLRFPRDDSQGQFWPGNNYYVYSDSNFLGAWHNGWILSDGFGFNEFPREQANAALTQFAGANHELKWGLDYQTTNWEGENFRTGYLDVWNFDAFNKYGSLGAGSGPFEFDDTVYGNDTCGIVRSITPSLWPTLGRGRTCDWVDYNPQRLLDNKGSGDAEMQDIAFYVRDRFTMGDHWTFNLGVRAEQQDGYNDIRRKVVDDSYIDPRVAISYDVKGDGKMLFSLNLGEYHAMLNQAWIAGGGGTAGGMHDQWNGYEGRDVFLFCDAVDAAFVPACGGEVGYNWFWSDINPGAMWVPIDQGIFDHSIDTYYKEEIILGMEWQFSDNWAFDVKYIDWKLKDQMFSNVQLDHKGEDIFLTGNYKNLADILQKLENFRVESGLPANLSQQSIDGLRNNPAGNGYEGLQVQVNRRFKNGWSLYNNVSWSETDTTGGGAWWNNTNSDYGENLDVLLTQNNIDTCMQNQTGNTGNTWDPVSQTYATNQLGRTVPVDCRVLSSDIGTPASLINRRGPNHASDREVILNSFGFKTWQLGSHNLTFGGHLTFQSGTPWHRNESVSGITLDGSNGSNTGVSLYLTPNGENVRIMGLEAVDVGGETRYRPVDAGIFDDGRTDDEFVLNLSGSWGFPLLNRTRGELRVEMLNATDEQKQRDFDGLGEVYPVRRYFQRPRQMRASFKISF